MFPARWTMSRSSLVVGLAAYVIGISLTSTVAALSAYRVAASVLSGLQAGRSATPHDEARVSSRPPAASPVSLRASPQTSMPSGGAVRKTLPRFAQAYGSPYSYYGERNYHYRYEDPEDDEDPPDGGGDRSTGYSRSSSGAHTTLCVRLCDGYYFPISFSVGRSRFEHDAQTCERSCPGQVRLFVHPNPGGEVDGSMVDLSGKPYRDLKTAFLYRAEHVPSCRCKPDPWDSEARQQHRVYALEAATRKGKAKAERAGQDAASVPQANAPARVADAPPSEAPRRRSNADDTTERMGLGGRRESRERPSPSWARETDWITRALGLR
jgi:Protein of unknown function (DUF2865)